MLIGSSGPSAVKVSALSFFFLLALVRRSPFAPLLIGFVCSYYSYRSITLLLLLPSFCAKKLVSEWSMEESAPSSADNGVRRLATAFKAAFALGLSISV